MTALFVLAQEYRAAAAQLADLELDEQTIADTLESLSGDLEVKATNVAMFVKNLESTAAAIKDAEVQMASRRKAIERRAEGLHRYLLDSMRLAGVQKIECPYFALAIKKNPPSVVIDSAEQIPAQFMRQPEPPPAAPDKTAIKDALKQGLDVPGCRLVAGERLDIR